MDPKKEGLEEFDEEREAELKRKLEATLFISGRFLSIPELVALTEINPIILKKLLADLEEEYKDSGIVLIQQKELWKMDVAPEFSYLVNKLAGGSSEFSKAEQESLAIIAYKQPLKQSVLVKIRGNKAYDHVKKFVEMGLISKKKVGHTSELSLTDNFYDYFSLSEGENPQLEKKGEVNNDKLG